MGNGIVCAFYYLFFSKKGKEKENEREKKKLLCKNFGLLVSIFHLIISNSNINS